MMIMKHSSSGVCDSKLFFGPISIGGFQLSCYSRYLESHTSIAKNDAGPVATCDSFDMMSD